jgi:hypothetical protein
MEEQETSSNIPVNNAVDKFITVTIENEVVHNILVSKANGEHYQDRLISIFMSDPTFTLHDTKVPIGSTFDGQNFIPPVG